MQFNCEKILTQLSNHCEYSFALNLILHLTPPASSQKHVNLAEGSKEDGQEDGAGVVEKRGGWRPVRLHRWGWDYQSRQNKLLPAKDGGVGQGVPESKQKVARLRRDEVFA